MLIYRTHNLNNKYAKNEINKVEYFNLLIKNYAIQLHYSLIENKDLPIRKINCEELEFNLVNCCSIDNNTYITGIEYNFIKNNSENIIIIISNDDNLDIYNEDILNKINYNINNLLNNNKILTVNNLCLI